MVVVANKGHEFWPPFSGDGSRTVVASGKQPLENRCVLVRCPILEFVDCCIPPTGNTKCEYGPLAPFVTMTRDDDGSDTDLPMNDGSKRLEGAPFCPSNPAPPPRVA